MNGNFEAISMLFRSFGVIPEEVFEEITEEASERIWAQFRMIFLEKLQ